MDHFISWVPPVLFLVGYVLFVACFFSKDVLYLRAMAVIGQIALIPYYISLFGDGNLNVSTGDVLIVGRLSPHIGLICSAVLVTVNLVYIFFLVIERRPVTLSSIEKTVYELGFSSLSSRTFQRLFCLGEIIYRKQGDLLVSRDSESSMLYLIIDGCAIVELSPNRTKELVGGQFIGEMSFITGSVTSADVRAGCDNTMVLVWTNCDLIKFLDQDTVLSHAFDLILSTDVTAKLNRMNHQNTDV